MLTGVHFLLTYQCTFECDHCFLYCSPDADGVFTIGKVESALQQMREMDSMKTAYFEGGDMDYPSFLAALKKTDYDRFVSVEWFGDEPWVAAEHELAYLRKILD